MPMTGKGMRPMPEDGGTRRLSPIPEARDNRKGSHVGGDGGDGFETRRKAPPPDRPKDARLGWAVAPGRRFSAWKRNRLTGAVSGGKQSHQSRTMGQLSRHKAPPRRCQNTSPPPTRQGNVRRSSGREGGSGPGRVATRTADSQLAIARLAAKRDSQPLRKTPQSTPYTISGSGKKSPRPRHHDRKGTPPGLVSKQQGEKACDFEKGQVLIKLKCRPPGEGAARLSRP